MIDSQRRQARQGQPFRRALAVARGRQGIDRQLEAALLRLLVTIRELHQRSVATVLQPRLELKK